MRDCRTLIPFSFEDNFILKKQKLNELLLKNKRDSVEFNMHSSLKMDLISNENPFGEISLANGLFRCSELFSRSALFAKKGYLTINPFDISFSWNE